MSVLLFFSSGLGASGGPASPPPDNALALLATLALFVASLIFAPIYFLKGIDRAASKKPSVPQRYFDGV
ncbi:MAG: hypothetical protein LBS89_03345 [Zoogloeaceae bacterium]|nr:hypothetical protein [Zoogloeaceae bacterium]